MLKHYISNNIEHKHLVQWLQQEGIQGRWGLETGLQGSEEKRGALSLEGNSEWSLGWRAGEGVQRRRRERVEGKQGARPQLTRSAPRHQGWPPAPSSHPSVFQGALAPRPGPAQALPGRRQPCGLSAVFLSTFTAWSEGPRFPPDQLQPHPASPPAHFSMWTLWAEGEALKPSWGVWDTHRARPRSPGSKSAGLRSRPAARPRQWEAVRGPGQRSRTGETRGGHLPSLACLQGTPAKTTVSQSRAKWEKEERKVDRAPCRITSPEGHLYMRT